MFTTTVQAIVDSARIRHWAFADSQVGDGALLLYVNQRLRTHLSAYGAKIEGLVGTTMEYDLATVAGLLVAEVAGVPQYTTAYQDGWPIHLDGSGVPYYDTSEPQIATDPFGEHGGTPGFPLPNDMIRLIAVALTYDNPPGMLMPCMVVPEASRFSTLPGRNPSAFVSGNRLVPLFPYATGTENTGDRWFSVASIQISYVAVQTLSALSSVLNVPTVLAEALIADVAAFLAYQSKAMTGAERAAFANEAARVAKQISDSALDMLNEPQQSSVQYRG